MNIPLSVLTDAVSAMKMLREVADNHMTTNQFMQAMRAESALSVRVKEIAESVKVEVEA